MPDFSDPAVAEAWLRNRLAELDQLTDSARDSRRPVELDQTTVGRLSRMDAIQGQAMALETERRRVAERQRILCALGRIAQGGYGECLRCGEEIAPRRLALDPTVTTCIGCAGPP